ncbi:MAG: hypothetical protein CMM10_18635 [Rhodospirillaceae bacterium]|nr:hypothetical protein [Rhodospirillaceae bacterium]
MAVDVEVNDSRNRESLRRTQRFVALAFCRADILFELDGSQCIRFAEGPTRGLFGLDTGTLLGRSFLEFLDERDHRLIKELFSATNNSGRLDDVSIRLPTNGGRVVDALLAGYRVPEFDNNLFVAIKVSPPPPKPRPSEDEKDTESGIFNKDSFATVAAERIRSVQNAGADAEVTLVRLDNLAEAQKGMDEESRSNLMGTIGQILNDHSLGGDTAGRIDEESFGIVHRAGVDTSGVGQIIENASKELTPDGVALASEVQTIEGDGKGLTDDQLAKAIVYTMKSFGAGKSLADPGTLSGLLESGMAETMKSVEIFKNVCVTRNFDLAFMPICDLEPGSLHHVEALSRFRGEMGLSGSPYEMIVMAEEMGIISEFDLAVGRKAVDLVKKNAASGKLPPVAINVSGHSIGDIDFVKEFRDLLLTATNLSKLLSIEITESSAITDFELVNNHIQEFRQSGFHVALDDFGAGAASFDYLNSFDIDTVKFDGPVVKRAYATNKGKAFLASMATLCSQSGIETIAEMVEDGELAKFLAECGIKFGQGWYFGKPSAKPPMISL